MCNVKKGHKNVYCYNKQWVHYDILILYFDISLAERFVQM